MIYKNLIKANEVAGSLQSESAIKLYHFNEQVRSLNKALFYGQGCMDSDWVDNLIERGPILFPQLKECLDNETAIFKCDAIEKIYAKLNKTCTSLLIRLAWAL